MRSKNLVDIRWVVRVVDDQQILDALYDNVIDGSAEASVAGVENGLRGGMEPASLLYNAMIPALEEVGALFEAGEIFLPEMLISANAMKAAMEVLRPHLANVASAKVGTYVIGSVAGDIHDIGKNMCIVMLEGAGFEMIDLGVNVPSEKFVEAIDRHQPDIVGMSAFLTTTVPEIERNLSALEDAGLRGSVKVMIGGAPVTEQFRIEVGADGYAPDASAAARVAKSMISNATR